MIALIALQSLLMVFEHRVCFGAQVMASITIRHLDDDIKQHLRVQAAENGRSMEEEVRHILRREMGKRTPAGNLAASLRARFAPLVGVALDLPVREAMHAPPALEE